MAMDGKGTPRILSSCVLDEPFAERLTFDGYVPFAVTEAGDCTFVWWHTNKMIYS